MDKLPYEILEQVLEEYELSALPTSSDWSRLSLYSGKIPLEHSHTRI